MYYIFVGIQVMSIVILASELVYVINKITSKQNSYMLLLIIASLVNNVGYLKELLSTSINEALSGTRICYVGKPFIPVIVLMIVCEYCGINIPKYVTAVIGLIQASVVILVQTCNMQSWYYTKISFSEEGLFPHLVLEHGPMYFVFMTVSCICFVTSMAILVYRYKHARRQAEKAGIPYMFAMIAFATMGLIIFLFGITGGYDTTAPAYCICALLIMYSMVRYDLLDTVGTAKNYAVDSMTEGIIVVDEFGDPIYANHTACVAFPNIKADIDGDDISKGREYINYLRSLRSTSKNLHVDDRVYKVFFQKIIKNSENLGGMFLLHDISDGYHYAEKLETAVEEKTKDIESIQHYIISSFANIVEARDGVTGAHIKNTSSYVEILVKAMLEDPHFSASLDERLAALIIEAAPLHDIGKIGVSDAILNKPGKLTDEEYNIMKHHTEIGAEIIKGTLSEIEREDYVNIAHDVALYHHEKWDGTGYPFGLENLEIPICARIMAIADVYDALRSERCYKKAFSVEKATEIIKEGAGKHFDPVMVELFLEHIDEVEQVAASNDVEAYDSEENVPASLYVKE